MKKINWGSGYSNCKQLNEKRNFACIQSKKPNQIKFNQVKSVNENTHSIFVTARNQKDSFVIKETFRLSVCENQKSSYTYPIYETKDFVINFIFKLKVDYSKKKESSRRGIAFIITARHQPIKSIAHEVNSKKSLTTKTLIK